jgi:hypothetical protein
MQQKPSASSFAESCSSQWKPVENLQLTMDGLQIQPANQTKKFCPTLDSKLNWSSHLNEKERQVRKIFFSDRFYSVKTSLKNMASQAAP